MQYPGRRNNLPEEKYDVIDFICKIRNMMASPTSLLLPVWLLVWTALPAFSYSLSSGVPRKPTGPGRQTKLFARPPRSVENYEFGTEYYAGDGSREDSKKYWDEVGSGCEQRGGIYKVKFGSASSVDPKETQLDWEVCSNGENEALVLLPPEAVERPSAVLHFVGGTFFGSLPKVWYKGLLEGIVRNTQCAIIVTPIPVTFLRSPLNHISLSRKLKDSFEYAWASVLEDEYSDLSGVPLCAIGHSLGARLLVVMTTLTRNMAQSSMPAYKSFILISFTNYGASAGVPGISALLRQSKKEESKLRVSQERGERKKSRHLRREWWSDDDDYLIGDGEDLGELVDDIQKIVKEQAATLRKALTPDSKDLEFSPTPDQLWKAIEEDLRYAVQNTLVVQFDDDTIDQSAKLAYALYATNSSSLHYARLRGVHLSPVSVDEKSEESRPGQSSTYEAVWRAMKGLGKNQARKSTLRDLRQVVSRYILDVVTK